MFIGKRQAMHYLNLGVSLDKPPRPPGRTPLILRLRRAPDQKLYPEDRRGQKEIEGSSTPQTR